MMKTSAPLLTLFFICCGLQGVLSSPTPQTTTHSPTTTIGLNETNATLSDGPVILSEGDVDILILNLGGILNDEELYNQTEGNNSSSLKQIRRREAADLDEDSLLTAFLDEPKEAGYVQPNGKLTGTSKKPESTTKSGRLPTIIERKKRSIAQHTLLTSKNNNPSTQAPTTQHTLLGGTPSKPLKRSVNEENFKTETDKIEKDLSKHPTLSKLINKRSDNQNQYGPSHHSSQSTTVATPSLLSAKNGKNSQTTSKIYSGVFPTFQSYSSGLTNLKPLTSNQQLGKTIP